MFDNDLDEPDSKMNVVKRNRENQESKKPRVKSDIFQKIQALEKAEQERLEREKANEERMKRLLQLEMERQGQTRLVSIVIVQWRHDNINSISI